MDRVKKLKVKKTDGTFTDYIPIGTDAINVDYNDTTVKAELDKLNTVDNTFELKLNKKPYYYNNVADMKADTKLKAGDMTITLGYYTYNDGKGEFYKIRALVNTDVIDDINIIALNNFSTLIAEKIPDYNINQLNTSVNSLQSKVTSLENTRDFELTGRTILLGDSYGGIRNGIEGWEKRLQQKLGLNDNDCYKYFSGGGFVATTTYLQLLQNNINNIQDKDTIKNIVVIGGDNDLNEGYDNIQTAMETFENYVKTNFPNATIFIGMFMYSTNRNKFIGAMEQTLPAYSTLDNFDKFVYLTNIEYAVRDSLMLQSDGVHLNELGQKHLTQCIYNCLKNGSCTNNLRPKFFNVTLNRNPDSSSGYMPYIQRNTNIASLCINNYDADFDSNPYPIDLSVNNPSIVIGNWTNTEFLAFESPASNITLDVQLHIPGRWLTFTGTLSFNASNQIVLYVPRMPDLGLVNIDHIGFRAMSKEISSRLC